MTPLLSTSNTDVLSSKKEVDFFKVDETDNMIEFGEYSTIASQDQTKRKYISVKTIGTNNLVKPGELVWIRGRVASVRAKGNACFLVLRSDCFYTIQACHFKDKNQPDISKQLIKFTGNISTESIVDIIGVVSTAEVKSCTQNDVEIQIKKIFTVSKAPVQLPFLLDDASRSQIEIDNSVNSDRPFSGVTQV